MSGARERILASVRHSLQRDEPLAESIAAGLEARLTEPRPNALPALAEEGLAACFTTKLTAAGGRVSRAADVVQLAILISAHLSEFQCGRQLLVAPDPWLNSVPWSNELSVERRAATGDDRVSVAMAFAGIAETGTAVLLSSPDNPTTLNFLPEDHIVVLPETRLVRYLEDAWARLRAEFDEMPRTVNLISGPSKTADVEQTLQVGAHGPRRLHVVLVRDA